MSAERVGDRRNGPGISEALLLGTQALVAIVAVLVVYQVGVISPGCSPACDFDLFNQVNHLFRWAVVAIFGASLVAVLVAWALGRRARWAPLAGIILTIAAAVWATIAGYNALTP